MVLRITLLTQGGEQHETDKEPGNALAEQLAHPDWANHIAQLQLYEPTLDHGDPRHCCWCFNPARSVSRADSPFVVLMSAWNRSIALRTNGKHPHPEWLNDNNPRGKGGEKKEGKEIKSQLRAG
jgi:hypothetical protein